MKPLGRRILLGLLLLAAVAGSAYALFGDGLFGDGLLHDSDDDAPLTLYGSVDIREVALAFRQAGRLATVAVDEGDTLRAGDPVARLDDEPFREAVDAAAARVDLAAARLAGLERGARPQEIEQARAGVDEAEARLEAARRELERKQGLLEPGAASAREVEATRERHDTAVARLDAARQAQALAREGFRAEDIEAGRAELRVAEAELERARTALADTVLVAPSDGVLLTRAREPGAMVAVGAPIATLSLHDPVVVRAYVPEPHLGDVAPGTPVRITTDSSPTAFRGRVGFVAPRAEFTPKSVETPELRTDLVYRLRIVVDDPHARTDTSTDDTSTDDTSTDDTSTGGALLQGMPVTVTVETVTPDTETDVQTTGR